MYCAGPLHRERSEPVSCDELFLYLDPYDGNQVNFFFLPGRRHSFWRGMGAEGPGGVLSALHHSLGRAALLCPGETRDHSG